MSEGLTIATSTDFLCVINIAKKKKEKLAN
jgi:hypothetical protein